MAQFDLARASSGLRPSPVVRGQPDLLPFRGQCLVHRSQLQQAAGEWTSAVATAEEARRRLADPPHPALGLARYQQGELCRLLGHAERAAAPTATPAASVATRARRGVARALTAADRPWRRDLRRALQEARTATSDRRCWPPPSTSSAPAGMRPPRARRLRSSTTAASASTSPVLEAMAAARDRHRADRRRRARRSAPAPSLGRARLATLQMPYEAARTSVAIGLACAALSDHTGARARVRQCPRGIPRPGRRAGLGGVGAGSRSRSVGPASAEKPVSAASVRFSSTSLPARRTGRSPRRSGSARTRFAGMSSTSSASSV